MIAREDHEMSMDVRDGHAMSMVVRDDHELMMDVRNYHHFHWWVVCRVLCCLGYWMTTVCCHPIRIHEKAVFHVH